MNKSLQKELIILGKPDQPEIYYLKHVTSKLASKIDSIEENFNFIIEFDTQFNFLYKNLLEKNINFLKFRNVSPLIYNKDLSNIIGGFEDFLKYITENYSFIEEKQLSDFNDNALVIYKNLLNSNEKKYSFLELNEFVPSTDPDHSYFKQVENRTIVIELNFSVCPKTSSNFLETCKGSKKNKKGELITYKGCEIFRVIKNGYIQSGDLNHFTGAKTIYDGPFEDENFTIKHNFPGIVGVVKNKGKSHSNESQFYITLNSLNNFDGMFVAFGRVVKCFDIIQKISEMKCYLQRPVSRIEIVKCGEYI